MAAKGVPALSLKDDMGSRQGSSILGCAGLPASLDVVRRICNLADVS